MPITPSPAPINPGTASGPAFVPSNPTGQLAQVMPGFDPTPIINAQEQVLSDYLNQPVQDILAKLGLPALPDGAPPPGAASPEGTPTGANPMDPSSLIQPVTDALGTLGDGLFKNLDPTKMFEGISKAFESAGSSVQQALGSLSDVWSGAGGPASAAKTGEALANGAEVGAQSAGIGGNVATSAANVQQGQARLIEIINEFQAKIDAIGPNIVFPWGQAQAVEAATQAISMTTEVITELQSTLGAQGAAVAATGAPVAVTAAPEMGAQMIGPMIQVATGMASPLMQMATQGLSQGMQAVTGAVQTGVETATGLASSLGGAAGGAAGGPASGAGGAAAALSKMGGAAGGGGAHVGGGGGGGGIAAMAPSRAMTPMSVPASEGAAVQSVAKAGGASVAGGGMMGGGGAMGAGAGHGGKAGVDGSGHNAASFLHTSDQGGEIVGDLGNVAPPVIGEVDPNDSPDIELRI